MAKEQKEKDVNQKKEDAKDKEDEKVKEKDFLLLMKKQTKIN